MHVSCFIHQGDCTRPYPRDRRKMIVSIIRKCSLAALIAQVDHLSDRFDHMDEQGDS
jgi:hypothetical protein